MKKKSKTAQLKIMLNELDAKCDRLQGQGSLILDRRRPWTAAAEPTWMCL